jgi:hypothetical protein
VRRRAQDLLPTTKRENNKNNKTKEEEEEEGSVCAPLKRQREKETIRPV